MQRALFSFSKCRWIPWTIAGLFLVVAMVNGALAYFALQSDPGLVSEHPFELGNGYNRVLDAGAAQDALGWRGVVHFAGTTGLKGQIVAELRDPSGAPLSGLSVKAAVVRPVEPLPQQDVVLDASGQGTYSALVTLTRAGQWDVRVTAERGGDVYQFVQRIVVR
ncbi:MAG TPA: FixH family protein [Stellaceae bacterium]|nr:FixH family protein [Stellaceae bacterium]